MSLRPTRKRLERVGDDWKEQQQQHLPETIYSPEPTRTMRQMLSRRKRPQPQRSIRMSRRTIILSAVTSLIGYCILVAANHFINLASAPSPRHSADEEEWLDIVFAASPNTPNAGTIQRPPEMSIYGKLDAQKPDHGGLDIRILLKIERRQESRSIYVDYQINVGFEDLINGPEDDDWREGYFALDDDTERNPLNMWDDDTIQNDHRCRRTSWHRDMYPNCNVMHEYDMLSYVSNGETRSGAYRTVFLSNVPEANVIKTLSFDLAFNFEHYEYMRMDGLISEKLTNSSRIVDNYAFCGLSMISEALQHGSLMDIAVPHGGYLSEPLPEEPMNRNGLSPDKKLELSLEMVEAVATLHSYPGGVIVHDDIQLSQFLFTSNGSLKLNDFNRAEIMLFDQENQEYCRYRNNPGMGDWRSPEEYDDRPLNEKIDVWSLGNNMYAILTGLFPFYELKDVDLIKTLVQDGKTGNIDPRFFERSDDETSLAQIVQLCWEHNVEARPDIFQVREMLRQQLNARSPRRRSSPLLISLFNATTGTS